jgi:hypothetical protein
MRTHRPMPRRKTEGTAFNRHPATRPVEAARLQIGDVIVPEPGHPAVITRMRHTNTSVHIWGRYIWQAVHETPWPLDTFPLLFRVAVALPGEYPKH